MLRLRIAERSTDVWCSGVTVQAPVATEKYGTFAPGPFLRPKNYHRRHLAPPHYTLTPT